MAKDKVTPPKEDDLPDGEVLRSVSSVSKEEIERAAQVAKKTGSRTLEVLQATRAITEEEKQKALALKWGLEYCDLGGVQIPDELFKQVPDWLLKELKVIPISLKDGVLVLGVTDPLNVRAADEIAAATGYEVKLVVVCETQLMQILQARLGAGEKIDAKLLEGVVGEVEQSVDIDYAGGSESQDSAVELRMSEEEPIVKLVNAVLIKGISAGASDIHIQPEESGVRVRYRVDGVLQDSTKIPRTIAAPVTSRIKVMASLDIAEKRKPQDGRIDLTLDKKRYELRVSCLPVIFGEKIVMRVAEQDGGLVGLPKLGFSEDALKAIEAGIVRPYGMILVVGPTGSGKSTTLYSILDRVNTPEKNIITVENPVERKMAGLSQVDIGSDRSPLTFATALRSILRQDPNVIMIGEIRDHETALIAAEASLTGHLVLSTLHTNDAPGAVTRLIDMEIEPFLISSCLILVISQRLCRRLCTDCKQPYEVEGNHLARLGFKTMEGSTEKIPIFKAKPGGCSVCRGRGYKGRIGVFEILVMSDEIRALTLKRASSMEIREQATKLGMVPMLQDALAKILQGVTTVEEVLRVVDIETD